MPHPARQIPQGQLPLPLTSYHDEVGVPRYSGYWPGFGWEGTCADTAISTDSPDALQWCHDQGFINADTKTFFDTPLRRLCESMVDTPEGGKRVRAPKCAALLKKLGYAT